MPRTHQVWGKVNGISFETLPMDFFKAEDLQKALKERGIDCLVTEYKVRVAA